MNRKKILIIGIIFIIIIGVIGYYFINQKRIINKKTKTFEGAFNESLKKDGLTREEWEKSVKEADKLTQDFEADDNINQIQMSLMFFFGKNKIFPENLNELYPEFIKKEILENNIYLYAYSKDKNYYHLGVKINNPDNNQNKLKNDADFNSISKNYVNGFNGLDPIYDVANKEQ